MRRDIHNAALRAAARVAFATSVLAACSVGNDEETLPSDGEHALRTTVDSGVFDAARDVREASHLPCCWMVDDPNVECTNIGPGCTPWGPPVPPAMPVATA